MPGKKGFTSRAQLGACYNSSDKRWRRSCDRMLKETPDIHCLPFRKGQKSARKSPKKSPRKGKKSQNKKSPRKEKKPAKCRKGLPKATRSALKTGPRGGKYYVIKQGKYETKVYVKR